MDADQSSRRFWSSLWWSAAALLLMAFLIVLLVPGFTLDSLTGPSPQELEQEGVAIAQQIDRYRTTHGRLPASLEEAGVENRSHYGGWEYRRIDEAGFNLSIGDYGRDGFVVYKSRGMNAFMTDS